MALSPEQKRVADAYATCFGNAQATQVVLDDLTVRASGFGDPLLQAGATKLILHILLRRQSIRREQARAK